MSSPVTGALMDAKLKSGIVYLAASILYVLSAKSEMLIIELILNMVIYGSIGVMCALGVGVLAIEIVNYLIANKQYKFILENMKSFEENLKHAPVLCTTVDLETGEESVQLFNFNDEYPEKTKVILSDSNVITLSVDDFVKRIFNLQHSINMFKDDMVFENENNDLQAIYSLLQDYAMIKK